jgi:hypothetical protein
VLRGRAEAQVVPGAARTSASGAARQAGRP